MNTYYHIHYVEELSLDTFSPFVNQAGHQPQKCEK